MKKITAISKISTAATHKIWVAFRNEVKHQMLHKGETYKKFISGVFGIPEEKITRTKDGGLTSVWIIQWRKRSYEITTSNIHPFCAFTVIEL